jgi:molybdenum cofactor cytidylyltransferase
MIVDAVVMAAGESARLGRAKQLLPFAGQTLLGHAIATVRAAAPRRLLVILGARADEIRAGMPAEAVEIVESPAWRAGPGSSIHAALAALAASPPDGLLLAVCDQPLVPAAHFAHLRRTFEAHPTCIVASGYDEIAGVPALFPRALFDELGALPAREGARPLLRRHADRLVTLPCPGAGRDVDTLDDYRSL